MGHYYTQLDALADRSLALYLETKFDQLDTAIWNVVSGVTPLSVPANWVTAGTFTAGAYVLPSGSTIVINGTFSYQIDQNAATVLSVHNATSGTAARTSLALGASGSSTQTTLDSYSAGWTPAGTAFTNGTRLLATGAGGLVIQASNAAGIISFYTQAAEWLRILPGGSVNVGGTLTQTTYPFSVQTDQNAATFMAVHNSTSGTAARSSLAIGSSVATTHTTLDSFSAGWTTAGDAVASGSRLLATGSGGLSIRASDAAGAIRFYQQAAEVGRWHTNGFFGIATVSPDELLHVAGANAGDGAHLGNAFVGVWDISSTYAVFVHNAVKATTGSFALIQASDGTTFLNTAAGTILSFRVGNTDKMYLSNGLQIGSPTGGDKGAGSINAVTVWRNGTSLDRVFAPDYRLLPIPEMRAYYEEHAHLPTIPTAGVHEEGSTNMGALTDHLWETAEVHARYLADLDERLRALEGSR